MVKLQTIQFKGRIYFLGYKVVTQDLKSLGLRRNPNILTYPINEWVFLPDDQLLYGHQDFGGIWVARTLSSARGLQRYMKKHYNTKTRAFKACLDDILYSNLYRVKTKGVYLLEEVYSCVITK